MMIFTLFAGVTFTAAALEDGEYNIDLKAVNTTTGEISNADSTITKPVTLEVENNKIYVILEMADSMYDLALETSDGNFELAEELSENIEANTFTYRFPVENIDEPVMASAVVAAMGRNVNFKLVFEADSLTSDISKSTISEPDTSGSTEAEPDNATSTDNNVNNNVPDPITDDDTLFNLRNVILLGFAILVVTYGIYKFKKR